MGLKYEFLTWKRDNGQEWARILDAAEGDPDHFQEFSSQASNKGNAAVTLKSPPVMDSQPTDPSHTSRDTRKRRRPAIEEVDLTGSCN